MLIKIDQEKEMEALEAVTTRRSVRRYKDQAVPKELMDDLLKAAMNAPSAGNEQPWFFVVIQDRKILDEIPNRHPHADAVKNAPAAIVVCADPRTCREKDWWVQDCSAATENVLIAAHGKSLGAVWLGVYPKEDRVKGLKELLGLPEELIPFSIISVGYPAEKKPYESRYQSSRVHYNRW
jgi:nitroreductase